MEILSPKGITIAGLLLVTLIIGVLCHCSILPYWIFHITLLVAQSVALCWLIINILPKLSPRQKGWFFFWVYALPFVGVMPIASGFTVGEPLWDRLFFKLEATLLACLIITVIYNFIFKNKTKMRKKIVAGNWKMNTLPAEGVELANNVKAKRSDACNCVSFVVCPPFTHIAQVAEALKGTDIAIGAQDCASESKGAYTGEVAASMIAALGCKYVILGHSERRQYYGETSESLNKKMVQAYANGLIPIYCVGENLEEREAGKHFDVVKEHIEEVVYNLSAEQFASLVIAYEPVWAIGTGKTASAEQAQEIHAYIRTVLAAKFGAAAADTAILYGGSCKPSNAEEIFAKEDVDGGLIGGAALVAEDFIGIGMGFKK